MTEDAIRVQLGAIQKSVDDGFNRVDKRLEHVEADVKKLSEEGLPRRVGVLEIWKDHMSSKMWGLLTGVILALIGALIGVVI